jgi:hypothetical protein
MYKAVILPIARQDIKEAAVWYDSKESGLGKRFVSEVRQKVNLLTKNPHSSATRYDEVKTAVLDVFPFMIHYFVDES